MGKKSSSKIITESSFIIIADDKDILESLLNRGSELRKKMIASIADDIELLGDYSKDLTDKITSDRNDNQVKHVNDFEDDKDQNL